MNLPPPRLALGMWKRFALAIVTIVALAAVATATAGLLEVKDVADAIKSGGHNRLRLRPGTIDVPPAGAPQTLLILGSDKRLKHFGVHDQRSDTIILARLNADTGTIALMSIPRDLEVTIPGHGPDKINAAYSIGGPSLTAKTVKQLLAPYGDRFKINHIININFSGFQRAVNFLGCVYTDIDRYYFNDNAPPAGGGGRYATIDLKPGYQRMCGSDSLDYVRFRHLDNDIVRSARQQGFLRDAKEQYGAGKIFSNIKPLAKIFGNYTQYDNSLTTSTGLTKLLDLAINLGSKPIVDIPFPGHLGIDSKDPFVHSQPDEVVAAVQRFLHAKPAVARPASAAKTSTKHSTKSRKHKASTTVPAGMVANTAAGDTQALALGANVGLPVYYPKLIPSAAVYASTGGNTVYPRAYVIKSVHGHAFAAYRMTLKLANSSGDYVGVQGTTWRGAPILNKISATRKVGDRKLLLEYDGSHLRLVAWRSPRAVYWISNDLEQTITNKQMLAMAGSLTRPGEGH